MKTLYIALTIVGFLGPNIFVTIESIETGNILLWLNPANTIEGMFANRISTAFVVDLLLAVVVFFIWTYKESEKFNMKKTLDHLGPYNVIWKGRHLSFIPILERIQNGEN